MARPNSTTPIETTVMVTRSLSDWTRNYDEQLRSIFGVEIIAMRGVSI